MLSALVFAYVVGGVSAANPCGFAFLPVYFTHRLGRPSERTTGNGEAVATALAAGFLATAGFVVVFGIIGLVLSLGALWLAGALPWAGFAMGVVLAVLGVYVLAGRRISLRLPGGYPIGTDIGLRTDFLFGLGYGTASLSCTLPVFLSITGIAVTGGFLRSLLSFIAFGIGMGTVLTAIAVGAAISRRGLEGLVKNFLPYAYRFGGGMLLLAGLYVVYYWGSVLFVSDISRADAIVGAGETVSTALSNWIGSEIGKAVLVVLLVGLVALFAWSRWTRRSLGNRPEAGE